jgi:hypothetical protein
LFKGNVRVELLVFAHSHSLAQWVFWATKEELDGAFLDTARKLEPENKKVIYALLEKRPNVDGEPDQRAFEQRIVAELLNLYPNDSVGIKAKSMLSETQESLSIEFINHLSATLEALLDLKLFLQALKKEIEKS